MRVRFTWPEPLPARLGRWARRHKPLVAAAAALLVTAVVALSATTVLVGLEQAATDRERTRAEDNLRVALVEQRRAADNAAEAGLQRDAADREGQGLAGDTLEAVSEPAQPKR